MNSGTEIVPRKRTKILACGCLVCFEDGRWITLVRCV
jgi:hypothetical protein